MAKQKLRKDQMHLDFSVSFSLTWTRELCLDCEIQRGEKQMWWSFNIQDMNYEIKWRNLLPKYRTSSAFTCGILFSVNQILQEFQIGFGIGTIALVCGTAIGEKLRNWMQYSCNRNMLDVLPTVQRWIQDQNFMGQG